MPTPTYGTNRDVAVISGSARVIQGVCVYQGVYCRWSNCQRTRDIGAYLFSEGSRSQDLKLLWCRSKSRCWIGSTATLSLSVRVMVISIISPSSPRQVYWWPHGPNTCVLLHLFNSERNVNFVQCDMRRHVLCLRKRVNEESQNWEDSDLETCCMQLERRPIYTSLFGTNLGQSPLRSEVTFVNATRREHTMWRHFGAVVNKTKQNSQMLVTSKTWGRF